MTNPITEAPADLEQLILYEIATKNFTSPDGPESGTFASLEEKLPYLEALGINAIWLTGHQHCESNHFYNIWSEYACIRPDRLDPSLGTEQDFRHLIDNAHRHGIKVLLDVITHGVMKDSPLVREHPDWFKGESWGMMDFDWYGDHPDLDQWWVETWLRYVREFGVDGFRLDVAHYRNDLWALIRKKAAESGKEIITVAESGPSIRGVVDILQHGEVVSHNYGVNRSSRLLYDVAGACADRQSRADERYDVRIFYEDGTVQDSGQNTWYQPEKVPEVLWEGTAVQTVECGAAQAAYESQTGKLRVENIFGDKPIRNVQVRDKQGQTWNSRIDGVLEVDYKVTFTQKRNGLLVEFPLRIPDGQFLSIQLSCHDNGWDGFPEGENPYGAQGSRYLAGYAALLAPGIPVFMSGEEFDADYRPLPGLSPKLFGGEPLGKGRWLYGSWIDWEQLRLPEKAGMLEDVKQIIGIRNAYSRLVRPCKMGDSRRNFRAVGYESGEDLPVPYCYQGTDEVLVIAANPFPDRDVSVRLKLGRILDPGAVWEAAALFGDLPDGAAERPGTAEEWAGTQWRIGKDHTHQGGLLVLKFRRIS